MKKLILFLILNSLQVFTYAQDWEWVKEIDYLESPNFTQWDRDGNLILTEGNTLKKLSATGELLWNLDLKFTPVEIKLNPLGDIFIGGNFFQPFDLEGFQIQTFGSSNFIIIKYNAEGELQWFLSPSSGAFQTLEAFDLDPQSNLHLSGTHKAGFQIDNNFINPISEENAYYLKISGSGEVKASRNLLNTVGSAQASDYRIKVVQIKEKNGKFFLAVKSSNPFIVSSDTLGYLCDCYEIYYLTFNDSFELLAQNKVSATATIKFNSFIDDSLNIYIHRIRGSQYGATSIIEKWDINLDYKWFKYYDFDSGVRGITITDLILDDEGLFFTGYFGFAETNLEDEFLYEGWILKNNGLDAFIGSFNKEGDLQWLNQVTGKSNEKLQALNKKDSLITCLGSYKQEMQIGPFELNTAPETPASFLAQLNIQKAPSGLLELDVKPQKECVGKEFGIVAEGKNFNFIKWYLPGNLKGEIQYSLRPKLLYNNAGDYSVSAVIKNKDHTDSLAFENIITIDYQFNNIWTQEEKFCSSNNYMAKTYQWYVNENILEGEIERCITPTDTGSIYQVITTYKDGCISKSEKVKFEPKEENQDTISFIENHTPSHNSLTLHPNPTSTHFTLSFEAEKADVTVTDFSGKVMLNREVLSGENISTSGFSKGIYFVQVRIGEDVVRRKLVVN